MYTRIHVCIYAYVYTYSCVHICVCIHVIYTNSSSYSRAAEKKKTLICTNKNSSSYSCLDKKMEMKKEKKRKKKTTHKEVAAGLGVLRQCQRRLELGSPLLALALGCEAARACLYACTFTTTCYLHTRTHYAPPRPSSWV